MKAGRQQGGGTTQIIDREQIIKDTLNEVVSVHHDDNISQSIKTRTFKRIADKAKTALYGRKNAAERIAITTYKRYLSDLRNAIKATGLTHHSLQWTVARKDTLPYLIKQYPEYADLLEQLRTEHAETIGALKNTILKLIQEDKDNPNRRQAFADLKALKVHHETLYHLLLDDVLKAEYQDYSEEKLTEKKNNAVPMVYADIQRVIADNINSESYSYRAYALALACGRRAIELLLDGDFTVTGEYTVLFDGQAKKQKGIDAPDYEIYTLIPAAEFVEAMDAFRRFNPVAALADIDDTNRTEQVRAINGRTANTLNGTAKKIMLNYGYAETVQKKVMGKSRNYIQYNDSILPPMFKDTRAIYTRVCLDTFFKTDNKWKQFDEDVFVQHLLGHGDYTAQAHYKQFKIDYNAPATEQPEQEAEAEEKPEPVQDVVLDTTTDDRHLNAATKTMDAHIKANPSRQRLRDYHDKVLAWTNQNPDKKITPSALYKKNRGGVGGTMAIIKEYLAVIQSHVDLYNKSR